MKLLRTLPRWFSLVATAGWIWLWRLAPVLCVASGTALAQHDASGKAASVEAGGLRRELLRGVSSSSTFNGVNRNDARAALKVWFDVVGQQKGFLLDSTVDILDSVSEIRERLESHSAELVTLVLLGHKR